MKRKRKTKKEINQPGLLPFLPDYLINIKTCTNNRSFDYGEPQKDGRPLKCQNELHSVDDDKDFGKKELTHQGMGP